MFEDVLSTAGLSLHWSETLVGGISTGVGNAFGSCAFFLEAEKSIGHAGRRPILLWGSKMGVQPLPGLVDWKEGNQRLPVNVTLSLAGRGSFTSVLLTSHSASVRSLAQVLDSWACDPPPPCVGISSYIAGISVGQRVCSWEQSA